MVFLETYVVPVCRFDLLHGAAYIRAFHGTAFYINAHGTFLSASHVISAGEADVGERGGFLGLCIRVEAGNVASEINLIDFANEPYDVCVGQTGSRRTTRLTLASIAVGTWRDVVAYGYPTTAQNVTPDEFWMYGRGFKGYVHREVKRDQFPGEKHPDSIETSFAMPCGLSGAPLFIPGQHRDTVVGVCVGVNRGETVESAFEEVDEHGETYREKRIRFEEYGLANDIRPLFNWKPASFHGRTLLELSTGEDRNPEYIS